MAATLGIVVFAHGSRDARWRAPVEAVAARAAALDPAAKVECAYLDMVEPDLVTAVERLVAAGVAAVRVVPLFLGVGKHLREDLPRLVDDLRGRHPGIQVTLREAVGEDPDVIELLARKALEM